MQSPLPKVLHKIGNRTMIERSLDTVREVEPDQIIVVVGYQAEMVKKTLAGYGVEFALQKNQLGTADAAAAALPLLNKDIENVLIVSGDDSAFYESEVLSNLLKSHTKGKNTLTFATLDIGDPTGLGRVVRDETGNILGIVEEKDATDVVRGIKEVNAGAYVFDHNWIQKNIKKVQKSPVTGEYYLVDLIKIGIEAKDKVTPFKISENQWHGVNNPEQLAQANKKLAKRVHFMGIGGAGASAVAQIAKGLGYDVTGCDMSEDSAYLDKSDIKISVGHSPKHLHNVGLLVTSPAIERLGPKNEEVADAKKQKIPVISWQEFQGKFLQADKFVIAVAGAYGKSTTTAMISKILIDAHLNPTCEIGAKVLDWGTNFRLGYSKYFVCEADEYNNNFLHYQPDIAVILNIAWDHPDFFKTKDELIGSYKKFIANIKPGGILIIPKGAEFDELIRDTKGVVVVKIENFGKSKLSIIGDFRQENADAALTVAQELRLNISDAKSSISKFSGLGRRLEEKGKIGKALFYDDYAVQPYTIATTAAALAKKYPGKKLLLVLEPHTISRVEMFFDDFKKSLKSLNFDKVMITDIFGAREKGDLQKKAVELAEAVGAQYSGTIEETAKIVATDAKNYDIVLTMGAGSIYKIYDKVKNA